MNNEYQDLKIFAVKVFIPKYLTARIHSKLPLKLEK